MGYPEGSFQSGGMLEVEKMLKMKHLISALTSKASTGSSVYKHLGVKILF